MELLLLLLLLKMGGGGLKPGMTGLLQVKVPPPPDSPPGAGGLKDVGMVAISQGGRLGWTNVLPAENARMRAAFPQGSRVTIFSGKLTFHAVRDGDGPQGGPFFRA